MFSPNALPEIASVLVIDSSAAINLVATGYAETIVGALQSKLVAVDVVLSELDEGRKRGRPHADLFERLVSEGLVEIVTLDEAALYIFENLVFGPAQETLDDGEAATIAYAVTSKGTAIIDERKATRICGNRFPNLSVGCTVDLFSHPNVEHILGRHLLSQAVVNALKLAHMNVRPDHHKWVIDLIGPSEAAECRSLPQALRKQTNAAQT